MLPAGLLHQKLSQVVNIWTLFRSRPTLSETRFTDTRLIRTTRYGQFALSLGKESHHIFSKFNPLNTDTFYGPLSAPYQRGFDCLDIQDLAWGGRGIGPQQSLPSHFQIRSYGPAKLNYSVP